MKKLALLIVLCLIAVPAMAEKYEDPIGVGVDVLISENPVDYVDKITAEYKYDFNNEENSLFVVAQLNAKEIVDALKNKCCD